MASSKLSSQMLETRVESLCGEELRRYRDELRAELGAQQREQQELRRQQAAWSKDLQELQEDLQVVCDGLRRAGVLTPKDLWDSRKARRGAELLKAAFQMTDIAAAVGHFAGPVAAGSLGASSPSHGAGIRDALPSILSRCWAPDLYVCGGQAYGTRSVPAERFDTDTQRWLPLPPMPTARSWCAAYLRRKAICPRRSQRVWLGLEHGRVLQSCCLQMGAPCRHAIFPRGVCRHIIGRFSLCIWW